MSKIIQYITGATLAMGLVLSGSSAMAHSKCERVCASRCDFRRDFRTTGPEVLVVVNNDRARRSRCDTARTPSVVVAVDNGRSLRGDRCGSRCGDGYEYRRFDRGLFHYGRRGW